MHELSPGPGIARKLEERPTFELSPGPINDIGPDLREQRRVERRSKKEHEQD